MLTLYVRRSENRLEIGRGELRAQFEQQGDFWVPAWMWQGDRRMLRFKNHEWLALGHVRPKAYDWEMVENSAERVLTRFWGDDIYFGVPVNWSVWVGADLDWPGFVITTEIIPSRMIELVECFSRFETPYDYAGNEESLCLIGQNPAKICHGEPVLTHPGPRNGLRQAAGSVGYSVLPTRNPVCCFRAGPDQKGNERYVTLLGHWDTCCFRHIAVAPTEFVEERRAYEFLVGALDWRCPETAESNVLFEGGQRYRQRLSIAFSSEMPGGTLDQWIYGAFERSVRLFFPEGAVMETVQRARAKKVSLADANAWLIEMISGAGVPGFYSPDLGIVNYTEGSCPEAGRFSISALAPWLGALAYQAYVTRRNEILVVCERWAERVAAAVDRTEPSAITANAVFHEVLPLLRYLTCFPNGGLHGAIGRVLGWMLKSFPPEGEPRADLDFCSEAFCAEAYILAGQLAGDQRLFDGGIACLERMNAKARDQLQRNGYSGGTANGIAGPQMRLLGCGHAVLANLIAYQRTHQDRYLTMAGTLSRYLVSLCYATFNDSQDPDFDTRGFANAVFLGRNQLIECSPVESSDSLRCVAYWLSFQPANPAGFYDLLWLLSRTFTGVFPAAREQRSGFSVAGQRITHPNDDLPTEIAYRRFPFIAYENPVRQTRQSPRASVEALQNYLTFGGGLASCDNDRLLVLLPRAAGYDLSERVKRVIHVYNPTQRPEETRLAALNLSSRRQFDVLIGKDMIAHELPGEAVRDIVIHVPPRRAVIVEVAPSRPPSTCF